MPFAAVYESAGDPKPNNPIATYMSAFEGRPDLARGSLDFRV